MPMTDPGRRGVLLPAMLLLILAMTLIAHGALVLAEAELEVSRVSRAALVARLSAEAGLALVLRDSTAWSAVSPLWRAQIRAAGTVGPTGTYRVRVTRVDRELLIWESLGGHMARPVTYRVARLTWRLSPVARLAGAKAVVESGSLSVTPGAAVLGDRLGDPPQGWSAEDCASVAGSIAEAVPSRRLPAHALLPLEPDGFPPLGMFRAPELSLRARSVAPGAVTPAAREVDGQCRTAAPGNWGSPGSRGPCKGHFVLVHATGDLAMVGGEGQGVLTTDGDLTLTSGARFLGVLLVGGDLRLEGGALVEGLVRALGTVSLAGSSRISGSGCATLVALTETEALQGLLTPPEGSWMGPEGPKG